MRRYTRRYTVMVLLFSCGCGTVTQVPVQEECRDAIVAFVRDHPGYFIGREGADDLLKAQIALDAEGRFRLEEFAVDTRAGTFEAVYGMAGPEPYVYKGRFVRDEAGLLRVGTVEEARYLKDVSSPD